MTLTLERADQQLQEDVSAQITWDPRFSPAEVGVEVDQGVVTLRGTVSSYQKVVAAGELAADVRGVRAVANELVVEPPERVPRDDVAVARACRQALEWDAEVPDERVECIVRDGTVTLRGTVEHAFERDAAARAVGRLLGVRRVTNEVVVERLWRTDAAICADLGTQLRSRIPWANLVGFRCRDGLLVLSGFVRSRDDRLRAESVAWNVAGVRHVVNGIAVIGDR